MSWNGSSSPNAPSTRPDKGASRARPTPPAALSRGLVAGLIVVALGGAAVWWLFGRGGDRPATEDESTRRGQIAETAPHLSTNVEEQAEAVPEKPKIPFWEQDNTNGFNSAMVRKWKAMRRPKPSYTNDMAKNIYKLPCEIFPTAVENELACFMTLKPGASVIGMPNYDEKYDLEFKESCKTPIVIGKDDDEYTRQLKKDMIALKIELNERMRNGETLADIMRATRLEAQRLAQVKEDIVETLRENVREAHENNEDPAILIEAANKLLEKNGIAPVKSFGIGKYWLRNRIKDNSKK